MASDYVRGSMPVTGQDKTFNGFMRVSAFSTAFCIVVLLLPILIFSVNVSWLPALIITVFIGVVIAPMLKLGGGWYATLFGMAFLTAIICAIF